MERLIGREAEKNELWRCYNSDRSEFVVVYGRRRIGKTFLVTQTFKNNLSFLFTGSHKAPKERQLEVFAKAISKYGNTPYRFEFKNWYHAFDALESMLETSSRKGKKVLFFDEMPWIDTFNSEFVSALEDFWNSWAALRDDICLIASGSATSWMVNNLVDNKGGLHNRITSSIFLKQFTLKECEEYLHSRGCPWDKYPITQCYMCLGGVPFYYSLLDPNKGLASNIDDLFFGRNAKLMNEFNDLYNVLFSGAESYIRIIRLLSRHREGLTYADIAKEVGGNGGTLTSRLVNLENCDFIMRHTQFGNKKKGAIYQLTDFFTIFYLQFVENSPKAPETSWANRMYDRNVTTWQGLTFEIVCRTHISQIKKQLGISGVNTSTSAWRSKNDSSDSPQTQIDMVIDRADRFVHLCEVKFSTTPFVITKEYEEKLRDRILIFREQTRTTKTLFTTFITTFGVKNGAHSSIVNQQLTLPDLFV